VLHPTDWEELLFEKNANADYYAANVAQQDPQTLWGKQVIASPVIAQNTGLVGAFGVGCVLYDREEARVDYTESGGFGTNSDEIFSRNEVVFRGEERVAFLVTRPQAFTSVASI
jgi:HK97 family phage major capsid protein